MQRATHDSTICGILLSQLEASLAMLNECIAKCPEEHWDTPIAKYPFWHVAYHTLCFVECYLSPSNDEFIKQVEARVAARARGEAVPDFQPTGMKELENEYPSRRFTQN